MSACVACVSRQPAVSFRERLRAARSGSSSAAAHAERVPTPHPPPFPCGGMIGLSDGVISMMFSPTLAKIVATLFVALVLVFRPQGLFGQRGAA